MAQLSTGILFDSATGSGIPSSADLSGGAASGLSDLLATPKGGLALSLRPAVGTAADRVTLIEGKYLDLEMQYSNDGQQIRFLVTPTGGTTVATAYTAAGTAHTIALSYDTVYPGRLFYALDGTSSSVPSAFLVSPTTDTTANTKLIPNGDFAGFISQLTLFQDFLTQAEVQSISNNPDTLKDGLQSYDAPSLKDVQAAGAVTGILGGTGGLVQPPPTADIQELVLKDSMKVGDRIVLSSPSLAYAERTYTLTATDVATPAATAETVVQNVVSTIPELGAGIQLNKTSPANNTIYFTGSGIVSGTNDAVVVSYKNSQSVTESAVQHFYDLTNVSTTSQSFPSVFGDDSTGTTLTVSNLLLDDDTSTTHASNTVSTAISATPSAFQNIVQQVVTGDAVSNGPIYAELKNIVADSNAGLAGLQSKATFQLFIDPAYDNNGSGGFNTFGFTLNVSPNDATIASIIRPPANESVLNNVDLANGTVSLQWLRNTPVTDYRQWIAEVELNLTNNASGVPDKEPKLNFSNISIDNNFFLKDGTSSALSVDEVTNTDRYVLSANVKQLPYNGTDASASVTYGGSSAIGLKDTLAAYEVFDSVGSFGASLRLKEPPTVISYDANIATVDATFYLYVESGTTAFDLTLELPSVASNTEFAAPTSIAGEAIAGSGGHTGSQDGRLYQITGTATQTTEPVGEFSLRLNMEYGSGKDIDFASVSLNDAASQGRLSHIGIAKADATGAFTASNLPAGEIDVNLLDTTTEKLESKITLEDARAVLNLAAKRDSELDAANIKVDPSDLIAADFNKDGRITADDALSILEYVAAVVKPTSLEYIFFDMDENDITDYSGGITDVQTPSISNKFSNKDYTSDPAVAVANIGLGPTIDYVGVLIGDVVT